MLVGVPLSNVFAQFGTFCGGTNQPACVNDYQVLLDSITTAVWIIFGLVALVAFVYAGIMFLTAQGEPEKLKSAKSAVVWGIVGIVVGIVAYSIVAIIASAIS